MQTSEKHLCEKNSNENFQQSSTKVKGFCYYRETICGYSACTCNTAHYHCQTCGYGTSELPHVMSHKDNCSACVVNSNYGRNFMHSTRSHSSSVQNTSSSSQAMDRPQVYASPYGILSDSSTMSGSTGPGTGSVPNNPNSGSSFFHRGLQQTTVFNPLLSGQTQPLYNGMFSSQTGYTSQNTCSTSSYNNYGHVEPPPWISENRVPISVSTSLQHVESDRISRNQYSDKAPTCSGQNITHACCGNKIGVSENINICSPLSGEALRTVNKELTSLQCKNPTSTESQSWYCGQGIMGYGGQQTQNSQQSTYKCNEQFLSCSVSQINMLLHDSNDLKHSSDSNVTDSCFDQCSNTNKQLNQSSMKGISLEQNKDQEIKYCSLQKINQSNGQSVEHISNTAQQKLEQSAYTNHSSLYGSSGEVHDETLYSQSSLILNVGSDSSHTGNRFQSQFISSKHTLSQNNMGNIKNYGIPPGQLPVLQQFQDHGRCGLESGIACDVMDSCLQSELKTVSENSVNLQNNLTSNSSCCQLSVEATSTMSHENQSLFGTHVQQRSAVNCLPNCDSGMQLDSSTGAPQQLGIECNDADGKENSNHESSSVAGESDIIVEETEEEMTESEISIDEIKNTVFTEEVSARCLVCSVSVSSQRPDNQFIHMRGDSPVTSASHIPVVTKLAQVVSDNQTQILELHNEFICRRCLNLINTVDCLETKLAAVKQDLIQLFETRLISLKAVENWKASECARERETDRAEDNEKSTSVENKLSSENSAEGIEIQELKNTCDKSLKNEEIKVKDVENIINSEKLEENEVEIKKCDSVLKKEEVKDETISDESLSPSENVSLSPSENELHIEETFNSKFKCDVCSKSFSDKEYLNKHHQQYHTKQFSFYCDRCGKGFTLKRTLENHLLLHSGEFRFQCEVCGKLFIQRYSLDDHLRKHEGRFRINCQQCGKGFVCRNSLHIHMRTHTGERPYVCQHCGKRFSFSSNLTAHIRICSGDLPFSCDQCNRSFALITQLKLHVQTHHEGQYRFKCSICGKGFTKDSDRKIHARSHSGEKPYKCMVCGKFYSSLGNLNQHAKQHGGECPFKCLVCGQGFLRRSALDAHANQHTGVRPFSCDQCSKTFVAKRNLYAHQKWHAGTIKRYSCTVCGKSFNHGLQVHMRTHSGHKPYTCVDCGMSFTVRSTLNKHVKSKHKKS